MTKNKKWKKHYPNKSESNPTQSLSSWDPRLKGKYPKNVSFTENSSTTRRLLDRLQDHVYDTEKEHGTSVVRHFNKLHGGDTTLLQIQGIERVVTPRRGGDNFGILCKRSFLDIFP